MPDRVVKTTLVIDDKGAVRVVRGVGEEAYRTEHKLGGLHKELKGVGKTFGGLKGMLTGGLGLVGAGGVLFGLSDVVSKTKEVAAETEKFHTVTGIGTQSSLYYTQALKARGLSGEAVTKAFGFLAKNVRTAELQEQKYAQGTATATAKGKAYSGVLGRQAMAFKELGVNLQTFNQMGEQQKLETITKAFEAMAPGVRKTRLERELFGRGGNQLSTVLEKNNLGLSKQIDLAKRFFPTIKGGKDAMTELLEKQAESKMAWEGLELTLGQALIPVITEVMAWFSRTTREVERGKGPWGELAHTVSEVVEFFKSLWKTFENLVGPTNALYIVIGGLLGEMAVGKIAGIIDSFQKLGGATMGLAFPPQFLAGLVAIAAVAAVIKATWPGKAHPADIRRVRPATPGHPSGGGALGGTGIDFTGLHGSTHAGVGHLPRGVHVGTAGGLQVGTGPYLHPEIPGHYGGGPVGPVGPTGQAKVDMHMDGTKVAEALIRNPRARRLLSEGNAAYSLGMAARGPGVVK